MTLRYQWSVRRLLVQRDAKANLIVVHVQWEKMGEDREGRKGRFVGATPLSREGALEPFIAWEQLSEPQVLAWVQEKVVGSYAQHVDNVIARQIAQSVDPLFDEGLPWSMPDASPEREEP